MKTTLSLLAVLLLPAFAGIAAVVPTKNCYVDIENAIMALPEAARHNKEVEEKDNAILKAEAEARASIEAKIAKFNNAKGKLTEEARLKQETALGEEINKLQEQFAKRRMELNQDKQRLLQQMQTKIMLLVESIGRQRGCRNVDNKPIWASDEAKKEDDITGELNALAKKTYPDAAPKAPVKPAPKAAPKK